MISDEKNRPSEYGPETPVPIFQHRWEFERLLDLYKERKPKRVLEVGTYHGGTLYHWLTNAAPNATIVTLDSYAVGVDNRALYPEWVRDDVNLHVLSADSHASETALEVGRFGPFDWIFIDAGHYYGEVLRDWELYAPMAAPGGIVSLHDIQTPGPNHPEIEVDRLWRELQAQGYITQELIANLANGWGGIGIVHL